MHLIIQAWPWLFWSFHLICLLNSFEYLFLSLYLFYLRIQCLFNDIFGRESSFVTRIGNACRIKCMNNNPFNI